MDGRLHAKNQLDSSSRLDTIPACDGRTHDNMYRASIASRSKSVSVGLLGQLSLASLPGRLIEYQLWLG